MNDIEIRFKPERYRSITKTFAILLIMATVLLFLWIGWRGLPRAFAGIIGVILGTAVELASSIITRNELTTATISEGRLRVKFYESFYLRRPDLEIPLDEIESVRSSDSIIEWKYDGMPIRFRRRELDVGQWDSLQQCCAWLLMEEPDGNRADC